LLPPQFGTKEVMDALRLIQAGQKDLESRLARVENVLVETKESLKPGKASDKSNLFQNLRFDDCAPGSSQAMNQDSRDEAALPPNSSAAPVLPIINMLHAMTRMAAVIMSAFTRMQAMVSIVVSFDAVRFINPSFRESQRQLYLLSRQTTRKKSGRKRSTLSG
jgi:hypothetical protein